MDRKPPDTDVLSQRWIHSYEEDTETEMVYRPASFPFPPARGRSGFELQADGSCSLIGLGPVDRPELTPGTWSIDNEETPSIRINCEGSTHALALSSVDPQRLVVRKEE